MTILSQNKVQIGSTTFYNCHSSWSNSSSNRRGWLLSKKKTILLYLHPKVSLSPKSSLLNSRLLFCLKSFNIFSITFREDPNSFQKHPRSCMLPGLSIFLSCHFPSCSLSSKFTKLFSPQRLCICSPLHLEYSLHIGAPTRVASA